jgi:hypothetical protein
VVVMGWGSVWIVCREERLSERVVSDDAGRKLAEAEGGGDEGVGGMGGRARTES